MKTILEKNNTYKITGERGDFFITEDNKGNVKMFVKSQVIIVEIDEMPKAKVFKKISINPERASKDKLAQQRHLNQCLQNAHGRTGSTSFLMKLEK